MRTMILITILMLIWIPPNISADTIYTWKDPDGTQRFSNSPPPESVKGYKTIESAIPNRDGSEPAGRRPSYDQMVKQAKQSSETSRQQRSLEASKKAAKQKALEKEKKNALRQKERQRLEAEIEAIKNRAVSRTYPNGMKQAQIEALRKEIEKLDSEAAGTPKGN